MESFSKAFSRRSTGMFRFSKQRIRTRNLMRNKKNTDTNAYKRKENTRAWPLDHLRPSRPVPTDDVVSQVFLESSALEQVLAIHSGIVAQQASHASSQVKPIEVHSQKVMSGGYSKAGNSLGSIQVPRDRTHSGQGDFRLRRLSSLLGFVVSSLIVGDPSMTWNPLQLVYYLKAEFAAWESMKKTTFAGAKPAASNCVVASRTAETSPT
ncbi:uncharacterized protein TNCV_4459751 [Trichonephila clavipes]|nr:uncharacterized protein TNCV_4459751 [Trichonephila clavipes]